MKSIEKLYESLSQSSDIGLGLMLLARDYKYDLTMYESSANGFTDVTSIIQSGKIDKLSGKFILITFSKDINNKILEKLKKDLPLNKLGSNASVSIFTEDTKVSDHKSIKMIHENLHIETGISAGVLLSPIMNDNNIKFLNEFFRSFDIIIEF